METSELLSVIADGAKSLPVNEEDYRSSDGLLMCGKCLTPKETVLKLGDKTMIVRCLCKCEEYERDKQEKKYAEEQRKIRINEMRSVAFYDLQTKQSVFENDDFLNPQLSKISRRYVDKFAELKEIPKGLLFFGNVGTGKTFYASCIANALIEKNYSCIVTNFARIVNVLSSSKIEKQEYIDDLCRYDLLIIDDLSSERNTEYMNEIVMNVIDSRYRSKRPIIVTTNISSEELKNPQEVSKKRIYSRLLEMCYPVEVKGADHRKRKLKDDFESIKKMLEGD